MKAVSKSEVFAIDAAFLLRSSAETFHGCRLFSGPGGNDITFVYGFVRDLLRIRQRFHVTCGVVVFHKGVGSLVSSSELEAVRAALAELGARVMYEENSTLIDICERFSLNMRWIVSDDFLLSQIVAKDLSLLMPDKHGEFSLITPSQLRAKYGVNPQQVPDLLALSDGDNALMKRNQAAKFIQVYGGIDLPSGMPKHVKSSAIWQKVATNRENLLARRKELAIHQRKKSRVAGTNVSQKLFADVDQCETTLTRFGFHSLVRLLKDVGNKDPIIEIGISCEETRYRIVRTKAELREVEKLLSVATECAVDTETSGKDPRNAALFGVSVSVEPGAAFYLPVIHSQLDGIASEDVLSVLRTALASDIKVIGHNLKYDGLILRRNGIEISNPYFDTMLAAYECFGDLDFFNLGSLAKRFLGRKLKRYRDIVPDGETFLDVPLVDLVEHACSDADTTLQLYTKLRSELTKRKLLDEFLATRMAFMSELLNLEYEGVGVDRAILENRSCGLLKDAKELQKRILAELGGSMDLGSLKSIREHLIKNEALRDDIGMRTLTATLLDDLALRKTIVADIVKYRRINQRLKGYSDILDAMVAGKVFPLFNQVKTAGVDFSSDGPSIDEALTAGAISDRRIFDAWFDTTRSLGRLVELTKDAMLEADLAKGSPGCFLPENFAPDRAGHADLLLSLVTSSSDNAMSKRLLLSRVAEVQIRRGFEERYPGVFRWLSGFKKDTAIRGFAEFAGKRRYFEGLHSSDMSKRNRALVAGIRWVLRY
jgi:DNA polymerase I